MKISEIEEKLKLIRETHGNLVCMSNLDPAERDGCENLFPITNVDVVNKIGKPLCVEIYFFD